ncbi:MAG: hypothetical protein ACI9ND_003122, partial [Yoonia sp.]
PLSGKISAFPDSYKGRDLAIKCISIGSHSIRIFQIAYTVLLA